MTGGRAVILGKTGRNFAAGMSGGLAYVLDEDGDFKNRCNPEMVDLEHLEAQDEIHWLRMMIERHADFTGSTPAHRILDDWVGYIPHFIKVYPKEFRRALLRNAEVAENRKATGILTEVK